MKSEHIVRNVVCIALLALMTMNAGCTALEKRMPNILPLSEQERSLAGALDQLRTGKEQQAKNLLEKVVEGAPAAGVTDEALFRLALLSLRDDGGKGLLRAQELLERLADKYPDSLWTRQSAPLLSHLTEARALRNRQRELKNLKEHNLSLSRDNRELRQSLEQLKQLDLELEQRIKR
jgi:hypothetical protein